MEKDYKVEMKPTYWKVVLSSGEYSDYEEATLVFSGNSEEEIWNFLCRYTDDVAKESEYTWGVTSGTALAMKWNDKKFISKKYKGEPEDIRWSSGYDIAKVEIARLNIIYFLR